jgi:hypothetical protein
MGLWVERNQVAFAARAKIALKGKLLRLGAIRQRAELATMLLRQKHERSGWLSLKIGRSITSSAIDIENISKLTLLLERDVTRDNARP